jgi:hypothetical protein
LTLTGEFEQFENGKTFEFTSAADLMAAAPGDDFIEQMAGIAFQPGADPLVGAPGSVIIASTLPSVAASAALADTYASLAATLESKIWGLHGNLFAYTLTDTSSDTKKKDLTLYKQGETEALTALGSGSVLDIGYAGTYATKMLLASTGPRYDTQLGDVTGEVQVVLNKNLDPAVDTTLTSTVGDTDSLAESKITIDPSVAFGLLLQNVVATTSTNVFSQAAHGLSIGSLVTLSGHVTTTTPAAGATYVVLTEGFTTSAFKLGLEAGGIGGTALAIDATGSVDVSTAALTTVAIANTDDLFTKTGHGLNIGDRVKLSAIAGAPAPSLTPAWDADTVYVVRTLLFSANDFTLALDADGIGGAAVTADGDGTCTVTYQAPTVTITGADDTGADAVEVFAPAVGSLSAQQTTGIFSRVDSIVVGKTGYPGTLNVSWTVKKVTRQSAQTLKTLASVLGDLPSITAAVKNARAASMTLGDLDTLASSDFKTTAVALRCDTSEFVRLINARSRFITAERELPTTAATWTRLPSTGVASGASGGTTITVTSSTGVVAGDIVAMGSAAGEQPLILSVVAAVPGGTSLTTVDALPIDFSGLPVFKLSVAPAQRVKAFTGSRRFLGGATGTASTGTRTLMSDALKLTQTAITVCMSLEAADLTAAFAHAVTMAGTGAREIQAFGAVAALASLDDIDTATMGFNSRHMAIATEEIRVIDTKGARRWLDPRFQALQVAAMQAGSGIADPVTNKRPRVIDTRSATAWNGTKNANDIIARGAIAYRRDSLGFLVTRGITTYRASDDVNQTELSANESTNWQIRDMRAELEQAVGKNSAAFDPDALVGLCIARGRKQVDGKMITKFFPDSVYLKRSGDTVIIGYGYMPAVPNNFIILKPSVMPVEFSFNLAA